MIGTDKAPTQAPAGRKPPFVVDYKIGDRTFSVMLAGPTDWADAEAHLAAIAASGTVTGSDAVEVPARAIDLWTAMAELLLAACASANRLPGADATTVAGADATPPALEMALAGAAVMVAGGITCGFDRCQAATCAAAVIDEAYRVTP